MWYLGFYINELELLDETLKAMGIKEGVPLITIRPDLINDEIRQRNAKSWEESQRIARQLWDEAFGDLKSASETIE